MMQMPYFVHNREAVGLASAALSNALETVRNMRGQALTEVQMLVLSERVVQNVNEQILLGERDPLALKVSGVHGLLTSQVREAQAKERRALGSSAPPDDLEIIAGQGALPG